ncbi:MAG: M81 family metallopeptidase [Pseudomonadota bacterium]
MTRVAIAGFQHETNTFGLTKTSLHDFEIADSWPELLSGEAVVSGTNGINLPIAGFIEEGTARGLELLPILWCAAEPAAEVTDQAFNAISDRILEGLALLGPLDGVYLDLHGAMVIESYQDGEGELLRRIRDQMGDEIPIAITLDLHANLTEAIVERATTIAIFRTYPHLDMAATGARAVGQLMAAIVGEQPVKELRRVPFLIPLHAQFTGDDPCRRLYRQAEAMDAELTMGFPASDIEDTGPTILAFGKTAEDASAVADEMLGMVCEAELDFVTPLLLPDQAVIEAQRLPPGRPVVIGDVQDNPGAGATSDTTGLLHALVRNAKRPAILGLMADAEMAAKAHRVGVGSVISGPLGAKSDDSDPGPYSGRFLVEALADGRVDYTGEMYGGGTAQLGPSAALRLLDVPGDLRVAVTSMRSQCLDLALFRAVGLEPQNAQIICVKSTVHFRADFDPIASRTLYAAAPGVNLCEMTEIPYRHLRSGIRLGPMGPANVRAKS